MNQVKPPPFRSPPIVVEPAKGIGFATDRPMVEPHQSYYANRGTTDDNRIVGSGVRSFVWNPQVIADVDKTYAVAGKALWIQSLSIFNGVVVASLPGGPVEIYLDDSLDPILADFTSQGIISGNAAFPAIAFSSLALNSSNLAITANMSQAGDANIALADTVDFTISVPPKRSLFIAGLTFGKVRLRAAGGGGAYAVSAFENNVQLVYN